jgi:hypothetical protein
MADQDDGMLGQMGQRRVNVIVEEVYHVSLLALGHLVLDEEAADRAQRVDNLFRELDRPIKNRAQVRRGTIVKDAFNDPAAAESGDLVPNVVGVVIVFPRDRTTKVFKSIQASWLSSEKSPTTVNPRKKAQTKAARIWLSEIRTMFARLPTTTLKRSFGIPDGSAPVLCWMRATFEPTNSLKQEHPMALSQTSNSPKISARNGGRKVAFARASPTAGDASAETSVSNVPKIAPNPLNSPEMPVLDIQRPPARPSRKPRSVPVSRTRCASSG